MEYEPMPKIVPIRPDLRVEERARAELYGKDWELPPWVEERSHWLGAFLLMGAFVAGGLLFAALLRCAS